MILTYCLFNISWDISYSLEILLAYVSLYYLRNCLHNK